MASLTRILIVCLLLLAAAGAASAAPTTELHVVKFAADQTTVLSETTVDYRWMEANLPVLGDGVTHYYHQGPVFAGDKWDPDETTNFKDRGAVKGTDIRDLADLVGGAAPGDEVMVKAADGYHVEFAYENVYEPDPRQGPIGITWYNGDETGAGERQGTGYVPEFYNGMRLTFFADNSTNAGGLHVYGNWDMHETLPEAAQHFYNLLPSTSGLSVKWVDEVRVYEGGFQGEKGALVKSLQDGDAAAAAPATTEAPLSPLPLLGAMILASLIAIGRRG
ncbi:argininosuccinate synthase [Methanoculleus sp. FWC-SCC1]|uniref:Argininosuccinate synthase n=1 Tax=Methanoculleus frigidifontis TaxID=2584085 RepID=A0ABT8MCD1_9EURY|nr:argininosuccinate synthase [Methanoculleus sp. FWC-SCC1]MDN7025601.1 argininosuccinate synthase [Methanoculleus sp. FWC-SCC1]